MVTIVQVPLVKTRRSVERVHGYYCLDPVSHPSRNSRLVVYTEPVTVIVTVLLEDGGFHRYDHNPTDPIRPTRTGFRVSTV